MENKQDGPDCLDHASGEQVDRKRREALSKLTKIGVTGAAVSVSILASTRVAAASP
jgi:hypothetical protein